MADFRINVIVETGRAKRGVKDVERGLDRAGTAADRLRRRLQQAFTGLAVGVAIRQLINMADTLTNLNNRLRLVTTSEKNLVAVNKELFAIANRTRSAFESTAELFARVAVSSKELGVSQRQLLQFTESLNQAIILSGASATEASAGLIQLSQGLASGTLRGDELRSVLEQLPAVADVIAKSLGVTRGQLRELGAEGKITSRDIIDAFAKARDELDKKFRTTVVTVGQSLTVLRNRFLKLVGDFDSAFGITENLAKAILLLSDNLETLIPIAAGLATIVGIQLARVAVPALTGAIYALWAAITAHPIGILITALAALAVGLTTADYRLGGLGNAFGEVGDTISAFGSLVLDIVSDVVSSIQTIASAVSSVVPQMGILSTTWDDIGKAIILVIEGIVTAIDFMRAAFIQAAESIKNAFLAIPRAIDSAITGAINSTAGFLERQADRINDLFAELPFVGQSAPTNLGRVEGLFGPEPAAPAPGSPAGGARAAAGGPEASAFSQEFGSLTRQFEQLRKQAEAQRELNNAQREGIDTGNALNDTVTRQNAARAAQGAEIDKIIAGLQQEAQLLQLSRPEREIQIELLRIEKQLKRELTEQERMRVEAQLRVNQELQVERQLLDEIRGPMEDYAQKVAALERLLAKGAITTGEFNAKTAELRRTVDTNAQFIGDALEHAFSSAADALAEFVRTGSFDFKKFVNNLLADLTRLAANQLFKQLLSGGLFGGGGGGLLGGLFGGGGGGGLFGFANGGSMEIGGRGGIDNNLLSLNGTPVARVSRGERLDITPRRKDRDGGGRVQVVMNIQTPDADSFQRSQNQILQRTQFALERARNRNS